MSLQEGKTRAKVFECNESLDELVLIKFVTQVKKTNQCLIQTTTFAFLDLGVRVATEYNNL